MTARHELRDLDVAMNAGGCPITVGERIDRLEQAMREGPPLDVPVTHHFAPGLYAREVTIPAGALVTGKVHRTRHLNVISAGHIAVYTEDTGWRELRAPSTFLSEPGTRRVGFAFEDTVWTTFHPTDETDLERIEAAVIEPHDSTAYVSAPNVPNLPSAPEAVCRGSR